MSETMTGGGPARRRGLRWWAWTLIAVGALAILAVPVVAVLGFLTYVEHSISETAPDQAFLPGPRQQPDAKTPVSCPEHCFALDAPDSMAVSAQDASLLSIDDERYGVGEFEQETVAAVAPKVGEQWQEVGGDEECAFVPGNAPYFAVGADSTSEDPIVWVQTWQTGDEMLDIAARVFATSEEASAFMRDLHDRVAACPWQDLDVPAAGGLDTSLIQITAQAAIDVPDDVAAVGWVREGTPGARWRSYVWDLQRGNLVVQVRVLTDGRVLEHDVAAFAELQAERLSTLQPSAP